MKLFLIMLFSQLLNFCCEPIINRLAFFPDQKDINYTLPDNCEDHFIKSSDGVNIHAILFKAKESKNLIVYFHGNAGNIFHRLESLQKLCSLGINVLGVSYRGYGKSEGKPSEKGIYKDAETAVRYALDSLNFTSKEIFILGRSIGSTSATEAALNFDIAGLILVTPLYTGKEMAKFTGLSIISPLAGKSFDNSGRLKKISAPTLIIHGTKDDIVPYWMGEKLYKENKKKTKLITIENGTHNELEYFSPDLYWKSIEKFIKEN